MKRLILIKQTPAIQLGHLYEHIFCAHVDAFFYERHLFPQLDYSLVGRMFYGGVVYIDIELYTEAAITFAKAIPTLNVVLNETTISVAASQLLAEKEEPFSSTGYENVKFALERLHGQPWLTIDDIELLDIKGTRRKANPFYIAEGKPLLARKLTVGITLADDFAATHRELLPLFRQFAWLITATLQGVLADTYGYFSFNDTYKNTKKAIGLYNTFKVANANDEYVNLADNLEMCLEVTRHLQQHDAFTRHMNELHKVSHYNHPNLAPNLEKNYKDTRIFIGPKGWQKIATPENCDLLLRYMSVEIKFGRSKVSHSLLD